MEQQSVTSNGVNIFFYKMPNTHSICISLYVKAGVLYENENVGITHFLEHLHFRKLGGKTQKELYHKLESIGADFRASSYKEFMCFYLTSSPKYFSELAKFSSNLLGKVEANPQDVNAEKRLISSEIRESNLKNDIDFISNKYIWKGTNLENSILGSISSVREFKLEELQNEKERVFAKQNIFFYVTGCFCDEDIKLLQQEIEQYDLNDRPNSLNNNIAQIPANFLQRNAFTKISQRSYNMHDVKISFDIDMNRILRHELLYLDSILTDGLCSLLRSDMIEKRGLIYSLSSTIEQYNNIGVYYFTFTVHKSKLYESIKSFISVIKKVKKGISEENMETTKVFKTENQTQKLDDPEGLNWIFAYENHILKHNYADVLEIAKEYEQVTSEQLTRIANEIFKSDNIMLISLGDKKGLSEIKLQKLLTEI